MAIVPDPVTQSSSVTSGNTDPPTTSNTGDILSSLANDVSSQSSVISTLSNDLSTTTSNPTASGATSTTTLTSTLAQGYGAPIKTSGPVLGAAALVAMMLA